jgi:hypothetical protein
MNNEPVVWINLDRFKDEALYLVDCVSENKVDNMGITTPLYTHPVKELTDEEIEQVRVAIMGAAYWCADENMPEAYNAVKVCCSEVLAILRKAQEK